MKFKIHWAFSMLLSAFDSIFTKSNAERVLDGIFMKWQERSKADSFLCLSCMFFWGLAHLNSCHATRKKKNCRRKNCL